MKERIRVKIRTSLKDLYAFMLYHTYTGFEGLFGLLCGILCLIAGLGFADRLGFPWFLVADVFGILYTIGNPVILYARAIKQAKKSIVFVNDIIYFMDTNGFSIKVAQESARFEWSEVTKVVCVGKRLLIYMGRKNAYILPLEQLGVQTEEVVSLIKEAIPEKKLKGKIFRNGKNN